MHEQIGLNIVRLNKKFKMFQNYPSSTVNWNSAIHELQRMYLIILRGRSTNDKTIQVVVEKIRLKIIINDYYFCSQIHFDLTK